MYNYNNTDDEKVQVFFKINCLANRKKATVQAMCDFRNLNAYFFFTSGDLLDAPKWEERMKKNQIKHTQHDSGHFDIALELACYIVE